MTTDADITQHLTIVLVCGDDPEKMRDRCEMYAGHRERPSVGYLMLQVNRLTKVVHLCAECLSDARTEESA